MDDELRRALRRVEPPEGFADRVLQRASAAERPARQQPTRFALPLRWAIAATLVAGTAGGGVWYRAEERRKAEGEEARRQVMLSLNIAGSQLRAIATRVNRGEER